MNLLQTAFFTLVACSGEPVMRGDSGGGDALVQPDGGSACCKDDLNASVAPLNTRFEAWWLAWKYIPSCAFAAREVWMASDAPAVAVLSDDNGKPGSVLVPELSTTPDGSGVRASLSALALEKDRPVWIAIRNVQPGSIGDGSHTPFGKTGSATSVTFTYQSALTGPWMPSPMSWPIIFRVAACP